METIKNSKFILTSVKLLSIVTTGVLWYLTYKYIYKEQVDEEINRNSDEFSESYKVVRLKVPTYAKGAVIGKNGSVIKKIQDKTKTTIKFVGSNTLVRDKNEQSDDWSHGDHSNKENIESYDEIIIRGLTLKVLEAEKEIKEIVASTPVHMEDVLIVDNNFIGKIIGKKGENIKRLKDLYNVSIDIDRSNSPQRKISLRGIHENIVECRTDILKMIECNPMRPEFPVRNNHKSESLPIPKNTGLTIKTWNVNEKMDVYVTSVVDCNRFYAHIINDDLQDLDKLIDAMTVHFQKTEPNLLADNINIGDIVAGFYEPSVTWQRVKIIELKNDGYEIIFLDYGDSEVLKIDKLRSYVTCEHFLKLPFQAVRLYLHGIKPVEKNWTEENIVLFENLTRVGNSHQLTAILKDRTMSGVEVILCDDKREIFNLGDFLINQKHAILSD